MSVLVSLTLLTTLLPQGTPPPAASGQDGTQAGAKAPLLTPAEAAGLREKLVKYLADDAAYDLATVAKERDKASNARDKTKEKFNEEWTKLTEKKGNLMSSMADLRAIFENCFLLKQPSAGLGQLRPETVKELQLSYSVYLPQKYKSTTPHRTLLVIPGTIAPDKPADWVKASDWFAATWDKSATLADTIVHVCSVQSGLEMDPIPDYSLQNAEDEEDKRLRTTFGTFGDTMANYNVDRPRVFIDCGRGACGFALRFMTLFPDRFAGAVLRHPVEVDDIRLGSLKGIPILLLRTAATATVVDALKKRLDEVSPNHTTVIDAADEYPHKGTTTQIEEWMKDKRRNMVPASVVIEPNHDRMNRAYWVDIDTADSLVTAPPDKKPRLEVTAERSSNRITVKAVGVERFTLFLNDDLVDLDKDFTIVVNDKAVTEKKARSFPKLREGVIQRNDWECLFPVVYSTAVPK